MAERAGSADKLGNTYEALWTWDTMLDLLEGKYETIEFEPLVDFTGIEFIITKDYGFKEYHSVKKSSEDKWDIGTLSHVTPSNKHPVLSDLLQKFRINRNSEFSFITTVGASSVPALERLAKVTQDKDLFLRKLSNQEAKDFEKITTYLNVQEHELLEFLSRFQFKTIDPRTLESNVSYKISNILKNTNTSSPTFNQIFGVFWNIREAYFGKKLNKNQLLSELRKNGYELADWNLRSDVKEKIVIWNQNFRIEHGSKSRILDSAIHRDEAEELVQIIKNEDYQVLCLTGAPGIGKSGVLTQFQKKLEELELPAIAISFKYGSKEYETLKNDLNANPEFVLAGIAKDKKSVLILDGIDSIGKLSGSKSEDWIVFTKLLSRIVTQLKNITVVLGCRTFDFDNDDSIRTIRVAYNTREIQCKLLPLSSVQQILDKHVNSLALSIKQKDLLRTPFFLTLFLEGDPYLLKEYSNPEEIFFHYWTSKNNRIQIENVSLDSILDNVIKGLIDSNEYQFERNKISDLYTLQLLIKEGILVEVGSQLSFLHPILQDYAIGKYFVRNSLNIKTYLGKASSDEKLNFGLKARSILAIYRSKTESSFEYFSQLNECIFGNSIPLFVKVHLLDWFGNLKNPSEAEWNFIYRYLSIKYWEFIDPNQKKNLYEKSLYWLKEKLVHFDLFRDFYLSLEKSKLILRLINRIPFQADSWFELAEKKGYWSKLKEAKTIKETINFANHIRNSNSSKLKSNILSEYIRIWNGQLGKKEAILYLLEMTMVIKSIDLQQTVVYLIEDGFFDAYGGIGKFHYLFSENLSEKFRIEILAKAVIRAIEQQKNGRDNIFSPGIEKNIFPHLYEIKNILNTEYLFYAENFFPVFLNLLRHAEKKEVNGFQIDLIWPYYFINEDTMYVKDLFLQNLISAFSRLAIDNPEELKNLIGNNYLSNSQTMVYLLFHSLSQNPSYFSETLYQMIELNPNALLIGDIGALSFQSGNYHLLPPRKVIRGIFAYLPEERRNDLVHKIMNLSLKADQYYLLLILLNEIPEEFRSKHINLKIAELKRRYEQLDLNPPVYGSAIASPVSSPINDSALEKMNDRQWIRAMKKYDSTYKTRSRDYLKGDGRQLSQALGYKAEKDPNRFVILLLNTNEQIESFYFSNVLIGISKVWKGKVDLDLVIKLIEKSHLLPGYPCLREISSLVSDLAEENLPDSILEIIKFYAEIGKDPFERIHEDEKVPDYLQIGINSDRGSIAWTIGKLISNDVNRYIFFKKTISMLSEDPKTPVRACSMIPVLYTLNYDRNYAIELYLRLLDGHFDLAGMQISQQFLGYAIHSHYQELKGTLFQMTKSEKENIQKIGSSIITYASFENKIALKDFRKLKRNISNIRRGVVEVLSQTVESEAYRERSLKVISDFFGDEDDDIKFRISHIVESLPDASFPKYENWLRKFIKNHAFRFEYSGFLKKILKLPVVSEKLVLTIGREAFNAYLLKLNWNLYYDTDLIDILFRGFHQSKNRNHRTKLFKLLDCSLLLNQKHFLKQLEINDGWKDVA